MDYSSMTRFAELSALPRTAREDSEMVISHSTNRRTNQRPTRTDSPPYLEPRKDSSLCRDC